MTTDILIAHPGKHHVLNLVAGCIKSGANVKFVTPFYMKGSSRILRFWPGSVGIKARGYFHDGIDRGAVVSPLKFQLRKLISVCFNSSSYVQYFDRCVARSIQRGEFKAKILLTLQDYMPQSVRMAKDRGFVIWSDQISNQSSTMELRIRDHERKFSSTTLWTHDESVNTELLRITDVITVPSSYCLEGLQGRISPSSIVKNIPYGACAEIFAVSNREVMPDIVIVARANSIRKGGHLLIEALGVCGSALLNLNHHRKIRFLILGKLEPELFAYLQKANLPEGISFSHENIPHLRVAELYQRSSFFIMPALSEGRSLACIEAMHAGLPLIITKYCGIDGFESGKMGLEIEDTSSALAEALIKVFKMPEMWSKWGENSKRFASHFTWEAYEIEIGQLCKAILPC